MKHYNLLAGWRKLVPAAADVVGDGPDLWTTTGGLFVRINGTTVGPISGPSAASFAGTSPITVRSWGRPRPSSTISPARPRRGRRPQRYVSANGLTIGDASSNATDRANADTFFLLRDRADIGATGRVAPHDRELRRDRSLSRLD
jgi:hypothetical protein